jgi:hypothetical protein
VARGCQRLVSSSGGNAGLAVAYCGRALAVPTVVVGAWPLASHPFRAWVCVEPQNIYTFLRLPYGCLGRV